jgi:beta-mannosidase
VTLAPNQATELGASGFDVGRALIFDARLLVNDKVVARAALWPEPFKYLVLPDPAIHVERLDSETLRVRAARPAKGVLLSAEQGVEWSDNMLDLMPGDERIVVARGLEDSEPQVRWLR